MQLTLIIFLASKNSLNLFKLFLSSSFPDVSPNPGVSMTINGGKFNSFFGLILYSVISFVILFNWFLFSFMTNTYLNLSLKLIPK